MNITIYKENFEYIADEFKTIENFIKKYISCKENNSFKNDRIKILNEFRENQIFSKMRLEKSLKGKFFVAYYIQEKYKLNSLEWFAVILAIMFKIDKNYKDLILKIENTNELTYSAILKLYFFVKEFSEIKNCYNILFACKRKLNSLCFLNGVPTIDQRLFENITTNATADLNMKGVYLKTPSESFENPLIIRNEIALKIDNFIKNSDKFKPVCIFIHGENGIGKKTVLNKVCNIENKSVIYIDLENVKEKNFENILVTACREAFFIEGYICFYGIDTLGKGKEKEKILNLAVKTAIKFVKNVFILSNEKILSFQEINNLDIVNIELSALTIDEKFKLWKNALKNKYIDKNLDVSELSGKFTLTPKQIFNTVSQAVTQNKFENKHLIDSKLISSCIYNQLNSNISEKATLIRKKHTWNELILNQDEKKIIKQACNQIKYQRMVYEKWGMGNRILYGTGLSMLFAGPSGTGKTMAAQVVANELELEIYKVDLSRVISKYIGESEKNIGEVFDSAKKSNVILLFDEMDSIFAKRTEVKDSHDRNANLETSYLLQKMEEHTGISILTTNFLENIDKAFFRRINYVVHFTFPNAKARKEIWLKMFTKNVPIYKDVDFDFISKQFEISGGSIKNAALTAAFMAASEGKKIMMKHMIKALEHEIKKQGKMVSKSDFGEYAYLL